LAASFRIVDLDIAAVQRSARCELTIVCSDADPYNPVGAQALYGDRLGILVTVIPGAGHITPASGYGRWPWLKNWTTA
jgi:predicted alpha/beta hydrolase family esterase